MPEPHRSAPDLAVLHALRCIGSAGERRVAAAADLPLDRTMAQLGALAELGLVESYPEPFGGWGLTDRGRTRGQEMLVAELELTGARQTVHRCYQSFMGLNPALLQICHDWQMRSLGQTQILNDHTDADYDADVLSRLIRIDDALEPVCRDLAAKLVRFGVYGRRLSAALERAIAGDIGSVADDLDSYHSVWFQLHEDLLVTQGLSRGGEWRAATDPDQG